MTSIRVRTGALPAFRFVAVGSLSTLLLGGCVGFSPDGAMAPVVVATVDRLGTEPVKIGSDSEADTAQRRAAHLLRSPLTAAKAVQVALLRNRGLQAAFNDLGVSEADFVKATLLPEPKFSIDRLAGMGDVEVIRQIVVGLYAIVTLPERQAIASAKLRAAQWRSAGEVMALAADVSRQYYMAVAAQDQGAALETSTASAQASAELAKQLGQAGNLNKLEQAREDVFYTELGAQLADARLQTRAEREKLTRLMGLWGRDIDFKLPKGLPPLPRRIDTERDVEAKALIERLDIQAARADLDALARQLGLTHATRYITDVSLTLQDDKEWAGDTGGSKVATQTDNKLLRNGFVVEFTIPLYDFGESKVRGARETYLAAANRLAQRAIDARSQAREAYTRYRGKYDLAHYYAERVLPLRKTILEQSTLHYNGMLADVSQLIIDARAGTTSNGNAIAAKRDFFLASVDLKAALVGNGPGATAPSMSASVGAEAVN